MWFVVGGDDFLDSSGKRLSGKKNSIVLRVHGLYQGSKPGVAGGPHTEEGGPEKGGEGKEELKFWGVISEIFIRTAQEKERACAESMQNER